MNSKVFSRVLVPVILVVSILACPLWSFAEEWEKLVEDLRSDNVHFNALEAGRQLFRLIYIEKPSGLREKLESLLDDPDYQMRQYASSLLVGLYKKEEQVPESRWPEALMRNMVEGLQQDWMLYRNTFPNALTFSRYLFDLKDNRPIQLLEAELRNGDPQSRLVAAILLARYGDKSTVSERNQMLLEHLSDDGIRQNGIAAYLALAHSGAEDIRQVLKEFEPLDWQQAAFIQCVSSFHGVGWSPSSDAIRQQWLEKAGDTSYPYMMEPKLAITALYLDPQGEVFLRGKEIPEPLERMLEAGRNVRDPVKQMKWAASWFPILDPEPSDQDYSARSFVFLLFVARPYGM
jgi:hypothetical protein